uniref:glutaminase n=2 Tax=Hucho hucho TaxID=62062 RepID=A0A4W5RKH8_9TELE
RDYITLCSYYRDYITLTGLNASDPRLKDCMDKLQRSVTESFHDVMMDRELFHKCVGGNIVLLIQAFRKKFIIPEFDTFVTKIDQIYNTVQKNHDGHVAVYIPHLAKFSPDLWGVSLCTVDGQRHSVGESKQPFCLQSCVKPLEYAVAIHEAGTEKVHRYVGMEPSGLKFNKLYLDEEDKPHNPMVNAGAIVISSLIKVNSHSPQMMDFIKKMAGQEYVGFSNSTFQSEKETGDRNFAIGYYLKEKKCFPRGAEMIDALDFYFQVNDTSSRYFIITNYGPCMVLSQVGLPAKSGVSGAVLLVVPNVMGVMCWSPPLDKVGNSVRGIHFCQELVSSFNFHNYDNLRHFVKKQDPRRQDGDDRNKSVVNLMFAAYSGDVSALRRFALSSMDMELKDYDSRTALHVAAAEGHVDVVRFLTDTCKVNPFVKDRWSSIPLDDALQFGHGAVVKVLQEYQVACQEQDRLPVADIIPIPPKLETVEGMV